MLKFFVIFTTFFLILSCTPPKKSLRERYVTDNPELKSEIKQAIIDGDIIVGMSKEQVYASWATPIFKGKKLQNDKTYEYWTYPNMKDSPFVKIYFLNDVVVKIEKVDEEPSIE